MAKRDEAHLNAKMVPGTTVRLSGRFLRNTGQQLGGEGQSRWTVQECNCRGCTSGLLVATDQLKPEEDLDWFTRKELAETPGLKFRHIARSNLVIHGTPSVRND